MEALKKVVQDLGAEISPQLLARELARGARSAADWLQRQQAYARSAAVMSMVCGPPQGSPAHADTQGITLHGVAWMR